MEKEIHRYTIDLPDGVVEVFYPEKNQKFEKGLGYVHDKLVYIYRGKLKKKKNLKPASVYFDEDKNDYVWVNPDEADKESFSADRVIPLNFDDIYEQLQNKANLKEVDHKLIESADDAYLVPFSEYDDALTRLVKRVLQDMRIKIDQSTVKDSKSRNEISNMKSNLGKETSKMSIGYLLKWIQLLGLNATIVVKFKNANGDLETIEQELK